MRRERLSDALLPARNKLSTALILGTLAATFSACTGEIGGDGDGLKPPGASTEAFTCSADATPASIPLRRLSRTQYLNTISDLVSQVEPADAAAILSAAAPYTDILPADEKIGPVKKYGGFTRLDQTVSQDHVDRTYSIATTLGAELTKTPSRLTALAGACATDNDSSNDVACMSTFIKSFGERVLRRAIGDDDVAFYSKPAGTPPFDAPDWADVTAALLLAPDLLYFVESGTDAVDPQRGIYSMGAYEVASRLSYHFWQTLPDEELLSHARSGDLVKEDVFKSQVARVFADPRTRKALEAFYGEWLDREDVAEMTSRLGTPAFDTLRGDYMPTPDLRAHMFGELVDMATYYSLDTKGTLTDFYTSQKSFAKTQDLATIYNTPIWDGASAPPDFTEPARRGLLTRAAMVATGSANTRPIMKGVFVRRALLCDDIPPPPANVNAKPPEPKGDLTSREEISQLTGSGACAGCHTARINPLGFVTENFDALGRFRAEELLIDGATGQLKGKKPVDTTTIPYVTPDDARMAKGAGDVSDWMLKSGKVEACFARVYFRFTFGRLEDTVQDGCALADLHKSLEDGADLGSVLERVALTPAFRQRTFGAAQ
jgi:hypothetical protein